jgi:nitrogen fixation/metabolism regulation signal transduction histidine kinase
MDAWLESFARANFRRSADTAHDLKTPLNVAVLNLELLRMRLRKVAPADDEKIESYTSAIELELRRMGRIFDAFFLLSTPPKNDEAPVPLDLRAMTVEAANAGGFVTNAPESSPVSFAAHESRIRQLLKLFFEGAAKVFGNEDGRVSISSDGQTFAVGITGTPESAEFDSNKVFKFYYTDPQGHPDLSLAVARLIAETYGGELESSPDERDTVSLRLSFPLGAR